MTEWISFLLSVLILACLVLVTLVILVFFIVHYRPSRRARPPVTGTSSSALGGYQDGEPFIGDRPVEPSWWNMVWSTSPEGCWIGIILAPLMISAALFNFLIHQGESLDSPGSSFSAFKAGIYLLLASGSLVLILVSMFQIVTGSWGYLVLLSLSTLIGIPCASQAITYLKTRRERRV